MVCHGGLFEKMTLIPGVAACVGVLSGVLSFLILLLLFFFFLQLAVVRKLFRTAINCFVFVMEYSDDTFVDFAKFMVLKRHTHSSQMPEIFTSLPL